MEVDQEYIDKFYAKEWNLYRRLDGSPVEKPHDKHKCLLAVISLTTGCANFIPADFNKIKGAKRYPHVQRCICSQYEENGLEHYIIEHKESNLKFLIGVDCFRRLFSSEYHQEVLDFNKETCLMCNDVISRKHESRIGFCSKECKKEYGYDKCIKCGTSKHTERQRKFRLCYNCKD